MRTRPPLASSTLAGLVCVVGFSGCLGDDPAASTPSTSRIAVEAIAATTREVEVKLHAVGTVQASEEAEIRPQVDGVILEIHYEQGSTVEAGDMLVRLDDRKAEARLALARAALDSARARVQVAKQRLDRHRELLAEELVSQDTFESIEAEYLAAAANVREQEAAVDLAARELDDYHIRAPFSGTVGARLVDVGNYVEKATPLVTLVQADPAEVSFRIPDRYLEKLSIDMAVDVTSAATGGTTKGTVSFIDPQVDTSTRMLSVLARVPNADGALRHGQFVELSLLVEVHRDQVVIPEEAVLSDGGKTWVFIVEEDIAHRRDVTLGERLPPQVEVVAGIRAGEIVVTGGQHRLHEGSQVTQIGDSAAGA